MGYNLFDCRSMGRIPPNEEPVPSEQTDKDRLSSFQNETQNREELIEARQCSSSLIMLDYINLERAQLHAWLDSRLKYYAQLKSDIKNKKKF
jgi:hypothetical protein